MMYGYGFGRFYGRPGWGRGNPYPFCRAYPHLPRGWWKYGYNYGYPAAGTLGTTVVPTATPETGIPQTEEKTLIENEIRFLEERMNYLKKRLEELNK